MITFVVDTVTGTVIDTLFASVMVTVHEPVSFPGVTVKLTAAPADTGVALAGLTCATYAPDVGTGEGVALLPEIFLPAEPPGLRYVATDCAPYEMFAVWSKYHAAAHVPAYLEILRMKIETATVPPAASPRLPCRSVPPRDPLPRERVALRGGRRPV